MGASRIWKPADGTIERLKTAGTIFSQYKMANYCVATAAACN
jgi:hypothetical protein